MGVGKKTLEDFKVETSNLLLAETLYMPKN